MSYSDEYGLATGTYAEYLELWCNSNVTGKVPEYAKQFEDYYVSMNEGETRIQLTNEQAFDMDEEEWNELLEWDKDDSARSPLLYGEEYDVGQFGKGVLHAIYGQDTYGGPAGFILLMSDGRYRMFDHDVLIGALPQEFRNDWVDEDKHGRKMFSGNPVKKDEDGDFVADFSDNSEEVVAFLLFHS